jgi:hypothetical protein
MKQLELPFNGQPFQLELPLKEAPDVQSDKV